jgi:Uma2 family endonuclease
VATQPDRLLMSVEDYLTLDRNSRDVRYEYIDGYAYMLAGGTANHSVIGVNIARELSILLRGRSCIVYNTDIKVRLSEDRYVLPDATVSCDSRDHKGKTDTIYYSTVVFEVLSPSTEGYDRGKKSSYYRSCPTIQEYVLVDTDRKYVEVYRRGGEAFWVLADFESGGQVQLASLGVSFPVDALYENVFF